jgi:ribosomal protein L19
LPTAKEQKNINANKEKLISDGIEGGKFDSFEQAMNYAESQTDKPLTKEEKDELRKGINIAPDKVELSRMVMQGLSIWARSVGLSMSMIKRDLIEEIIIRRAIYNHGYELIAKTNSKSVDEIKELEREGLARIKDALTASKFRI